MANDTTSTMDPARAAESNTSMLLGVLTTFHIIALVFVSLRLYSRFFVIKSPGKDDFCIILSALCAIGGWIVFLIQAQHGLGKHQDTISKADYLIFQHAGFWQSIVSATFALAFLKLSIGFNLLRLSPTNTWYKRGLWFTMVIVVCYSFMGAMTFFLHCTPMAGHWDSSLNPTCYGRDLFITFALVNTSFNIATDVLFASFPVPIIWNLQVRRKVRAYLIGILSLGYFAVAMGILKAVYQNASSTEKDKTFRQSVTFWGFLQLNVGIIAACAATLKPLVSKFLRLGSTNGSGYSRSRSYATRRETMMAGGGARLAKRPRGSHDDEFLELGMGRGGIHQGLVPVPLAGGKSYTTTFYQNGKDASSSEAMLGAGLTRPANAALYAGERGIIRTTEVRVSVREGR